MNKNQSKIAKYTEKTLARKLVDLAFRQDNPEPWGWYPYTPLKSNLRPAPLNPQKITVGDKVVIDDKYTGVVEEIKNFPTLSKFWNIEAVIKLDEKWYDGRTERVAIKLDRLKMKL